MLVKKTGENYYLRIDRGEEIIENLKKFCGEYKIESGMIFGLGSVTEAEIGLYDLENKEYLKKDFSGIFEIASMNGNISKMNGNPYLHLHTVLSDSKYRTYGGHLSKAIVGATCEILVIPFEGFAGRVFSEEIGLNLLDI